MTHRPQLLIDTTPLEDQKLQEEIFKEIDKYSITPRTFKTRTILPDKQIDQVKTRYEKYKNQLEQQFKTVEGLLVKSDELVESAVKTRVFSEGEGKSFENTNSVSKLLQAKKQELEDKRTKLESFYQNIDFVKDSEIYRDVYENIQMNSVARYGINASKSKELVVPYNKQLNTSGLVVQGSQTKIKKGGKSNTEEQSDVLLHPLEVLLIKNALEYLSSSDKTVLVDIFARENTKENYGKIKIQESLPETHTIVLYRNNLSEIVVIDPTNSDFSKHLAADLNKMFINGALDSSINILVSTRHLKIYEPASKANVGPSFNQYRDCIDIAVKIAFGLNKIEMVDVKKIGSLEIIKEVTNQQDVNNYLFFSNEDSISRIRQSSEESVRKGIDKLIMWIDNQIKSITQYLGDNKGKETSEKNIELLKKDIVDKDIVDKTKCVFKNFLTVFEENHTFFKEEMEKINLELQGEVTTITNGNMSD